MKSCLVAFLLLASPAASYCRQALALGMDVSGSVDAREYRLQLDGLAAALTAPEVQDALFAQPGATVRLMAYEWSGAEDQRVLAPWTEVSDPAALLAFANRLTRAQRADGATSTAIGAAMRFGLNALEQNRDCDRLTLDLSGDGQSNTGPRPDRVEIPRGVTINGLAIGQIPQGGDDRAADVRELASYFRLNVLRGPDAFVEIALGFEDFETAMRRKLLRELQVLALSKAVRQ